MTGLESHSASNLIYCRQQFIAGIYILGSGGQLKAGQDEVYIDAACKFTGPKTIYPFAFRTHSHSLGETTEMCVCGPRGGGEEKGGERGRYG